MTTSELIAYIKKQTELGVPEANYKSALLSQGWKIEDINEALVSISGGVPRPPENTNLSDYALKAKVITVVQILIGIPLLIEVILTLIWFFFPRMIINPNNATGPYGMPMHTVGALESLLIFIESYAGILVLLLIISVIVGFAFNHKVKRQTGKKAAYLSIIGTISIVILVAWFPLKFIAMEMGTAGGKPVIYLYPQKDTNVSVNLKLQGTITDTYPTIDAKGSWNVIAHPDGTLINVADNKEYSYLFWEGLFTNGIILPNKGFVVAGKDTKDFLQKTLAQIGLTPKEYNEFIVYWLPKMQHNPYNQIYFATNDYTDRAVLNVTPKPDSTLRVFMLFKSLNNPIAVTPETFAPFTRKGFTLVEWGGDEAK